MGCEPTLEKKPPIPRIVPLAAQFSSLSRARPVASATAPVSPAGRPVAKPAASLAVKILQPDLPLRPGADRTGASLAALASGLLAPEAVTPNATPRDAQPRLSARRHCVTRHLRCVTRLLAAASRCPRWANCAAARHCVTRHHRRGAVRSHGDGSCHSRKDPTPDQTRLVTH